MTDPERTARGERELARITDLARLLAEHYDSVQIFCTRAEDNGTAEWVVGRGNWFARFGQVKAWAEGQQKDFDDVHARAPEEDEE